MTKACNVIFMIFALTATSYSDDRPSSLGQAIASDKGKEFLDLVKQYDQDGRAQPGGPKIGPSGFAKRCLDIAERNLHVRPHSLMEAILRSPDTPEAEEAVDRFVREFVTDPGLVSIDQLLIFSPNFAARSARTTERLLRAIFEKNPSRRVKALACYCLAVNFKSRTESDPSLRKFWTCSLKSRSDISSGLRRSSRTWSRRARPSATCPGSRLIP